jgi:hypothetical protein
LSLIVAGCGGTSSASSVPKIALLLPESKDGSLRVARPAGFRG